MTASRWSPSPRTVRWLLVAALLPFAAIVISRWSDPPAATDGDYAQYLLHAKAIAEFRAYDDIGYIYTPMNFVGPRVQPPGWPIVLAPFVAVFGTDLRVFKVLVTILVAAFGIAVGTYFTRRGQPILGIAGAAAGPVALEAQYATGSALSDPLFCLLVWLTLIIADREGPVGWRRGALLGLLIMAALSVRVAGISVLAALILFAWMRQRGGRVKLIVAAVALVVGVLAVALIGFDRIPFLDHLVAGGLQSFSPSRVAETYVIALAEGLLYPFGVNVLDDLYHAVMLVPMVIGAVLYFRRGYRSALACFLIVYVCMLAVSPVREPRYAWPLMPLVMVWSVSGLMWVGERYAPSGVRIVVPKLAFGLVAVVTMAAAIPLVNRPPRPSLLGDPDTQALFEWVRFMKNTDPDMRVVFTNPRVLTLETTVPAMGIPVGDADEIVAELERQNITYVVVPRVKLAPFFERNFRESIEARAVQFPAAFSNATHYVRRFIATPPVGAPDSGSVAVARPQ